MSADPPRPWRLILSRPLPGPENMALDEALADSLAAGEPVGSIAGSKASSPDERSPSGNGAGAVSDSRPILRLYAWEPPCLSIGYAQPLGQVDFGALEARGWGLVRRPTGGRAILHTQELTYAVVGSPADPLFRGGVLASYRRISRALIAALQSLGLDPQVQPTPPRGETDRIPPEPGAAHTEQADPVCFQVPGAYEVTVEGKKLIGSAQVRRRGSVLQHGSLPLGGDLGRVCQVLRYPGEDAQAQAAARLRASATTLEATLGRPITWEGAADALRRGFEHALGADLEPVQPTPAERRRASEITRERYRSGAWAERV